MIEITKQFEFCAAHLLEGHKGECINLHGHTYKLMLTLCGALNNGMVVDFYQIKDAVASELILKIDHSFIFNLDTTDAAEKEIACVLEKNGRKIYKIKGRATVENLSQHIFRALMPVCERLDVVLRSVALYESDTSFARCSDEG